MSRSMESDSLEEKVFWVRPLPSFMGIVLNVEFGDQKSEANGRQCFQIRVNIQ